MTVGAKTLITFALATALAANISISRGAEPGSSTRFTGIELAQAPSRDTLFGDAPQKPQAPATGSGSKADLFGTEKTDRSDKPPSKDGLFGDDVRETKSSQSKAGAPGTETGWRGYVQAETAYAYETPEHWSKARLRLELGRQGRLTDSVKYKVTGRLDYDAVFDIEPGFYSSEVKQDQRRKFQLRETYLDVSAGDWELRLGRQHVVWGEVPGLFFADVVSARDLREFVLPEFDSLRIPQWAARAEYFAKETHLEFLFIPWVTVDNIGNPISSTGQRGTDFYPYPPPPPQGFLPVFLGEQKPARTLRNSNFGMRASRLVGGWDMSGFVYRATDTEANFYRQVVAGPVPAYVYSPRHDRITRFGGTLSKDLGDFLLKAEAVYTKDKGFSLMRITDPTGVVKLDVFDYLLGVDFSVGSDSRLYTYAFQRRFVNYDADIVPDRVESGITVQFSHKLNNELEFQTLFITSINRSDWMLRPKITWNFAKNWRLNAGVDVFHGPLLGLFGRFANNDRVYADIRYSF